MADLNPKIQPIIKEILQIRRELHKSPELAYKEHKTTRLIKNTLNGWGIEFYPFEHLETGGYCMVGDGKPFVAFRADIDGLPVTEDASHTIRSLNEGFMHACGHDYHTALALGLIKYLHNNSDRLNNTVVFLFQPAEEAAPGGAEQVIKESVWKKVRKIVGVHVAPDISVGKFVLVNGAVQASSTSLFIEINAPGGHTSKPHETVDTIAVSSQYIVQLQKYIRHKNDPQETVVLVFGSIQGGGTHNIIPQKVTLRGTLRTLNNNILENTLEYIREFSNRFSSLYEADIRVSFPTNCPATINDSILLKIFSEYMKKTGKGGDLILRTKSSLGADDFAFYSKEVPGLYILLGAAGRGSLHSGNLELNEKVLHYALEPLAEFLMALQ
ncbi:MAG TPA: amidohydrolase [Caldithrix abyssi]|uniref:Amidohydrolase n=1 Tax=Caldithrix abyssi TaxID=187145 RepID=A0A7V4U470_CALAY|nr:amidohydrolase [Caldithrix abyssi]